MPRGIFPQATREVVARGRQFAAGAHKRGFAAGAWPVKVKQLIAGAEAPLAQWPVGMSSAAAARDLLHHPVFYEELTLPPDFPAAPEFEPRRWL